MKRCIWCAAVLLLAGAVNVQADLVRPPFPKQPSPKQPLPPLPAPPGQPIPPGQPVLPRQPGLPPLPPPFPPLPPLPQPDPVLPGARDVELVVDLDPQAKTARLQIPANLLGAGGKRFGADAGRVPTLVAGLALTCAFVSGGFWLVRRGRGRTLTAVLLGLSLLVGVASVSADLGIGPRPRKGLPTPVLLPADIRLSGKLTLEVIPVGTRVRLIITKDMAANADKVPPR